MSTDTAPAPALETKPATEWMKGARTAHELIIRQAEGRYSADHGAAARGWQAQGGIYHRVPQAELEAG